MDYKTFIAVDNSGSMSGRRIEWAKLLAVRIASDLDDYEFISFGAHHQFQQTGDLSLFLDTFFCGGTDFQPTLEAVFDESVNYRVKSTLILITDGMCQLDGETLARYKDGKGDNFRIVAVTINGFKNQNPLLGGLEDVVIHVDDYVDVNYLYRQILDAIEDAWEISEEVNERVLAVVDFVLNVSEELSSLKDEIKKLRDVVESFDCDDRLTTECEQTLWFGESHYDDFTAKELVKLLNSLSDSEILPRLGDLLDYETEHLGRKTVLDRLNRYKTRR